MFARYPRLLGTLLLAAMLTLLLAQAATPARLSAAPLDNTATDLKAAALARVNLLAPDVPAVSAEIARLVGDYALVRVFPPAGLTDPALIVLRLQDGAWTAIAGPGTAFPPGDARAGAPDELFDFSNPYTGDAGAAKLAGYSASARLTYQGNGFSFQYPSTASVEPREGTTDGSLELLGPYKASQPFQGYIYAITLRNNHASPVPLDESAYAALLVETARLQAQGGPPASYQPRSATYFHVGANTVFQIDYDAGAATLRDFYVQNSAGGDVIGISTRVESAQNNPSAPLAASAVTLLLQSLAVGSSAQ